MAKTYKSLLELTQCIHKRENPTGYFRALSDILLQSKSFLDYPFESTKQIIEELGDIFPNDTEYDKLVDNLAELSERRYSELASGEMFVRRGGQKLNAGYYKESIVYFGKAVMKLAKEESKDGMCLILLGLGMAYRELGLIWASNNCYISACSLSFRTISESGNLNKRIYQSLEEIIKNELFIGRLPSLFTWYEMYSILNRARNITNENKEEIPFAVLTDGCLSTRILHTDTIHTAELQHLPDFLAKDFTTFDGIINLPI
jgi:tetratricopeptide (TPR) repeat protein